MDAKRLCAIARRCRELLRVVHRPEMKEQLRKWEQEIVTGGGVCTAIISLRFIRP